jgi:predicted membrane-bound mannosyltransferase
VRLVSLRTAALSGAVVGGLLLLVAWLFELPLGRVAALAPVVVVAAAAALGLFAFWIRVGVNELRAAKHPRMIVGVGLALVLGAVLLTVLGIQLPRE